ncbi:IS1 family transposase [Thermonema lapsum]|uniref:IS1 family transposase n=1 Tax=Thermonema lapsum TaxID=28195 RepID=A0A846MPQ7_9BACT|nr:IS1 family transposase [Thermonema lapsum]NIK73297.1 IS1 family transposase [Thermonema lapsum]
MDYWQSDARTFKKLYERLKDKAERFYTDDWEVYRKIIPEDKLIQSIRIEQSNSNVRHYLGRMTTKNKIVSKSIEMIDISLRISCCLNEYGFYEIFQSKFLSIFT